MHSNHKHHKGGSHKDHRDHASGGNHSSRGMSRGSGGDFLRRFWIVTFLLIPLAFTHEGITTFIGLGRLGLGKWTQLAIATAIFSFALVFFKHAKHEIAMKQYGMMTLVSVAVGVGYAFSVAATFLPQIEVQFYLEISTLIWILLFGHYLEARSSAAAGNALTEVAKLLPKQAHRLEDGKENDVDISQLQKGDVIVVKPGEKIPADGTVKKGEANVNESHITGESKPVRKSPGNAVSAGAICEDGSLVIELTAVGLESTVGQIQKLISDAQMTKPRSQRIADRAAGMLTFVAGIAALLTIVVWIFIMGESPVFALTLAITVLVIACPHALGLAIPTVTTITTTLASKNGIFLKDLSKIEVIQKADYIVFDKTGTLTKGEFGVSVVIPAEGKNKRELIAHTASLEQYSSHIIGHAVVKYAKNKGTRIVEVDAFENIAGKGVTGTIAGKRYWAGNAALMEERHIDISPVSGREELIGKTLVYLADKSELVGVIGLSDESRPEAKSAVAEFHKRGIKVAMLTGDNAESAKAIAGELDIDVYFADVLPHDKYRHIKELQEKGNTVIMVGDGVNDAPALTQADVGVAIGAGTDVAVEAGDVVLTRNNPLDGARLVKLSRHVYRKMIQNLVWALGYNVIAIPAAAGVFAYWGFFLRPEIGALVMSLSTVIVVVNALALKRINL